MCEYLMGDEMDDIGNGSDNGNCKDLGLGVMG